MLLLPILAFCLFPFMTATLDTECTPGHRVPPSDDCAVTLRALDNKWRSPGQNDPKLWGRTVKPGDDAVQLPVAYFLRRVSPREPSKKCEFFVDNVAGKERNIDVFNLQSLTLIASGVYNTCLKGRGQTGFGFPVPDKAVSVTLRYRDDLFEALGGESDSNVTYIALDDASPQTTGSVGINPIETLVSRAWKA